MLSLHELTYLQHSVTSHQGGTWTIDAITNAVTVQATDLDIRNLTATDVVTVDAITNAVTIVDGGGSITVDGTVAATQSGTWTIDSITNAVTVQGTNIDIRDLAFATDKVDVSGSSVSISGDVNVTQGTSPWVVSASNLDIRDLAFATDSVTAYQGGTWAVDASVAGFASWKTSQVNVAITATQVAATPLTGRKKIIIQNVSSKDVYLKDANTVAIATDGKLSKGASFEMELAAGASIWAIADGGTADIRVWEFAA